MTKDQHLEEETAKYLKLHRENVAKRQARYEEEGLSPMNANLRAEEEETQEEDDAASE